MTAARAEAPALSPTERDAHAALREAEDAERKNMPRLPEMLEALDEERRSLECGQLINLQLVPPRICRPAVRRMVAHERTQTILRIIMEDKKLQSSIGNALKERETR